MNNNNIFTNFSEKEIAVLKAVDALGSATVSQISKKSGVTRTTVYNFIDNLADSGMISFQTINGVKHYFAAQQSYSLLEAKGEGLKQKYQSFHILVSGGAVHKAIKTTLKSKSGVVYWMVGAPETNSFIGKRFIEKYIDDAFEKKLEVRTLRSTLKSQNNRAEQRNETSTNGADLPFKTTVIISGDAMIFVSPEHGGVGYTIKDQAMAESFRFVFDGLWKRSKEEEEQNHE